MKMMPKIGLVILVLGSCIGCDQTTKAIATRTLSSSPPVSLFHDIFRLQYIENPGAMLSLGAELPAAMRLWVLMIMVGCVLAGLLVYVLRCRSVKVPQVLAFSLMMGGGASNVIDRFVHEGRVIDFLNIGIGPVRTGIFNVADVDIMVGMVLLGAVWWRNGERRSWAQKGRRSRP